MDDPSLAIAAACVATLQRIDALFRDEGSRHLAAAEYSLFMQQVRHFQRQAAAREAPEARKLLFDFLSSPVLVNYCLDRATYKQWTDDAYAAAVSLGDPTASVRFAINLACWHLENRDPDESDGYLSKASDHLSKASDHLSKVPAEHQPTYSVRLALQRAKLSAFRNDVVAAITSLRDSIALTKTANLGHERCELATILAQIAPDDATAREAAEYIAESIGHARDASCLQCEANALVQLGHRDLVEGRRSAALTRWRTAAAFFASLGYYDLVLPIIRDLWSSAKTNSELRGLFAELRRLAPFRVYKALDRHHLEDESGLSAAATLYLILAHVADDLEDFQEVLSACACGLAEAGKVGDKSFEFSFGGLRARAMAGLKDLAAAKATVMSFLDRPELPAGDRAGWGILLGDFDLEEQNWESALGHFTAARRDTEDQAVALGCELKCAIALKAAGRSSEANDAFKAAAMKAAQRRNNSALAIARYELGLVLSREGKIREATLALRSACRFGSRNRPSLGSAAAAGEELGRIYKAAGQHRDALKYLKLAARIRRDERSPKSPEGEFLANCLAWIAGCIYSLGRHRAACSLLLCAVRLHPVGDGVNPRGLLLAAQAALATGGHDEASSLFRKAQSPYDPAKVGRQSSTKPERTNESRGVCEPALELSEFDRWSALVGEFVADLRAGRYTATEAERAKKCLRLRSAELTGEAFHVELCEVAVAAFMLGCIPLSLDAMMAALPGAARLWGGSSSERSRYLTASYTLYYGFIKLVNARETAPLMRALDLLDNQHVEQHLIKFYAVMRCYVRRIDPDHRGFDRSFIKALYEYYMGRPNHAIDECRRFALWFAQSADEGG